MLHQILHEKRFHCVIAKVTKNMGLLGRNLVGLLSSLVVALSVLWILDLSIQDELIFACMLGLVTFFFFKYLTSKNEIIGNLDVSWRQSFLLIKDYFFFVLCFFSIILVIIIPTVSNSLYVNWGDISIASWIRSIAAVFLCAYAPGYIIVHFIDRTRQFTRIESLAFSILLSLFFTALFSYMVFVFNLNVTEFIAPIQLGLIGFLSIVLLLLRNKRQKNIVEIESVDRKKLRIPITYNTLILIWIICFALLTAYFIRNYPSPLSDMGEHVGGATRFLSGRFSSETSVYNPEMWYQIFLGSFFALSGLPPVNAYFPLLFLTVLPYITFYLMVSAFFSKKNKKIPIIATFFTLTQGFGWLYALQLRVGSTSTTDLVQLLFKAGSETLDVTRANLGSISDIIFPIYVVGLPTLFMLIYLLRRSNLMDLTRFFLFSILTALVFLAHGGVELPVLVIAFFASIFFFPPMLMSRVQKLALSTIIGLGIGAGLYRVGGFQLNGMPLEFLFLLVIGFTLAIVFSLLTREIKLRLHFPKIKWGSNKPGFMALGIILLVYSYFLSFVVLGIAHFQESYISVPGSFYATPWFLFPLRLGIVGLLTLAFAVLWVYSGKYKSGTPRVIYFFVFIGFFSLIATLFAHYVIQNPFAANIRFEMYIESAVSVLAAIALVELTRRVWKNKWLVGYLLALLVIFGIGSQLLMVEGYYLNANIYSEQGFTSSVSIQEVKALDYLRENIPSNVNLSIATPSVNSYTMIKDFGEVWQPLAAGSPILFSVKSPESALSILAQSNVKYVYMAQRDFAELESAYPEGYMARLLNYLPVAFKNEEVTIYEVPSILSSIPSNISLVIPQADYLKNSNFSYQYPLEMCALSQLSYTLNVEKTFDLRDYSTIIITQDPRDNETFNSYLQWAKNGGNLVVLNSQYSGEFAKLMSIKSSNNVTASGIVNNQTAIAIPEISLNATWSTDSEIKLIASYTQSGNSVSAFALQKNIGNGEITYVEAAPYLTSLHGATENLARQLFINLPSLIKSLNFPHSEFSTQNLIPFVYMSSYPCFFGNAAFIGNVTIESNFIGNNGSMQVKSIDLSQTTLSQNDKNISNLVLANVSVVGLESNQSIKSTLTTTRAETLLISNGSITSLDLPERYNLTLNLDDNTLIKLTLKENVSKSEISITVRGGVLKFYNVSSSYIMLKTPSIQTNGQTSFSGNVYLKNSANSFENLFPNSPLTIDGYSYFRIDSSDTPSFISNFSYEGVYLLPTQGISSNWNEFTSIPWANVLASPVNFLLIMFVIGLAIVLIKKKQ
jgi:hypothetical protein